MYDIIGVKYDVVYYIVRHIRYCRFMVKVFAIFAYDVAYNIARHIVSQTYNTVCVTYNIVYDI